MKFNYQAKTKEGEVQMGVVEASSSDSALKLLQNAGLIITALERAEGLPFYARDIKFFSRVTSKDLVMFTRHLSLMFKSRIPLVQILQTLSEQTSNYVFRDKILAITQAVEGGTPLSEALAYYPDVFSSYYVNLVKSGEISGTLSEGLEYLADHIEREHNLKSKIKAAMYYPILVVVAMIGVIMLMAYFVVPHIAGILEEGGQELPFITTLVIWAADFLKNWGWILLLVFIALIVLWLRYIKTPAGRELWHKTILNIPLIKSLLKMIYVNRFAENLATLIRGGLAISRALEITGDTIGNEVYRKVIYEVRNDVRRGENISRLLREHPALFPPVLTQMVLVGEKTGTMEESLMNVVRFYQAEIERDTDALVKFLEPLLILFLGGLVGVLIAALFVPLYNLPTV